VLAFARVAIGPAHAVSYEPKIQDCAGARGALPPARAFAAGVEGPVLGIGLGVLAGRVNKLPAPDRPVGAELVEGYDDNAR